MTPLSEGKRKKPTDKERLDWLTRNEPNLEPPKTWARFWNIGNIQRATPRAAIDAAMRQKGRKL